jgi:hypothetical protein
MKNYMEIASNAEKYVENRRSEKVKLGSGNATEIRLILEKSL